MKLIKSGQKFLGQWGLHIQKRKEAVENPEKVGSG